MGVAYTAAMVSKLLPYPTGGASPRKRETVRFIPILKPKRTPYNKIRFGSIMVHEKESDIIK